MRVAFVFGFLCVVVTSFAQQDFRHGFIVTNKLDTLVGFVNFKQSGSAFKICSFKESMDELPISYNPFEIVGYGFKDDRTFESKVVPNPDQTTDSLFLEVIIKGVVSLYKLHQSFYVQKDTAQLYLLMNTSEEKVTDGITLTRELNQHVGTLTMLMYDCERIRSRIPRIRLVEKDLLKLVNDYNTCKGGEVVIFKESIPWFKATVGVMGGVSLSQIDFKSSLAHYDHLNGSFDPAWVPTIGGSVDFLAPRLNKGLSFHLEVFYMAPTYRLTETENYYGLITWDDITIKVQELNIPLGIRYGFPQKNIAPYFNAGFSSVLNLKTSSTWKDEKNPSGHEDDALPFKRYQYGFWGGIGVTKSLNKKFNASFEIRYELTNSIAKTEHQPPEIDSKIHNFHFTLGIRTK